MLKPRNLTRIRQVATVFIRNGFEDVLQIYGYPTSMLVDRKGRIIYHHFGFHEGDEVQLEQEIQALLGTG